MNSYQAVPTDHTQHLKLLTIFHFVVAGMLAVGSLFFLIYIFMGDVFATFPAPSHGSPMNVDMVMMDIYRIMGWVFLVMGELGAVMVALGGVFFLRRLYRPALIVSCVECIFMPLGTLLGIFSLIKLTNSEVKELFRADRDARLNRI